MKGMCLVDWFGSRAASRPEDDLFDMQEPVKYWRLLTEKRCVMFDTVVQVEFLQVKGIITVAFLEHASCEMRHIRAEGRTEVVSCPDLVVKFDE